MTQIEPWQISATDGSPDLETQLANLRASISQAGSSGVPLQYVEMDYETISLGANGTATFDIPLPPGIEGVNVKTLLVQSKTNGAIFTVSFQTQRTGGRTVYKTNQVTNVLYDMFDLPYKDADNTHNLHLTIANTGNGTVASIFTVIVIGVALI